MAETRQDKNFIFGSLMQIITIFALPTLTLVNNLPNHQRSHFDAVIYISVLFLCNLLLWICYLNEQYTSSSDKVLASGQNILCFHFAQEDFL